MSIVSAGLVMFTTIRHETKTHTQYWTVIGYASPISGHIRPNLTVEAAATLVHAFISPSWIMQNSLLHGVPDKVTRKLQLIQYNAAHLVTMLPFF